jgi:hypothetical protein
MADLENTANPEQVRNTLREWIAADDQIRALQAQAKTLRERQVALSAQILEFMRGQNLDNFVIEGQAGTIARQQRTVRVRPNKAVVRTQIAILLADQPQRMAEVLRTLEGAPGVEDANNTRELLTRRIPRTQRVDLG